MSLQNPAVEASAANFDELWESISPRKQVRLTSLLIDRVEFDGAGEKIAIAFHDGVLESLTERDAEVLA